MTPGGDLGGEGFYVQGGCVKKIVGEKGKRAMKGDWQIVGSGRWR